MLNYALRSSDLLNRACFKTKANEFMHLQQIDLVFRTDILTGRNLRLHTENCYCCDVV